MEETSLDREDIHSVDVKEVSKTISRLVSQEKKRNVGTRKAISHLTYFAVEPVMNTCPAKHVTTRSGC